MTIEEYLRHIEEILNAEKRARNYYRDTLLKLADARVKEVIGQIEKEEEGHVKAIETIYLKRKG